MMRLKIAFVKPPISGHQYRGTGTYTNELFKALNKQKEIHISLVNIKDKLDDFDLIHYPYFDPFFLTLPLLNKKPRVVTVHDLIPLAFPKFFPAGILGRLKWQNQKLALSTSNAIITDSYASKKDIVRITGINEQKIHVIYLGVGKEFGMIQSIKRLNDIKIRLKLPQNFILHIGDVNYNKNIPNLIKAFNLVIKSYATLNLVLIGKGFITSSDQLSDLLALIHRYRLDKKVYRIGYVDIDDLVGVYNLAKLYLQPSLAEGFGLPVLEAMACGCPIIASNVSSLVEIAGNSAFYINPTSYTSIAGGINELLVNRNKYQLLVKKGLKQAKIFNWHKTAEQTISVYKTVMQII